MCYRAGGSRTDSFSGFGPKSALHEACFYAQRNGFDSIRIGGGDSFSVGEKLGEIEAEMWGKPARRRK